MNIAPVSFGKTVKVIGNKEIAKDIVRLANSKSSKPSDRIFQKEIKNIFNDIDSDKTAARCYKAKDGYYILSGEEAKEASKISKKQSGAKAGLKLERLIDATKAPFSIFVNYNSRSNRHIDKFQ